MILYIRKPLRDKKNTSFIYDNEEKKLEISLIEKELSHFKSCKLSLEDCKNDLINLLNDKIENIKSTLDISINNKLYVKANYNNHSSDEDDHNKLYLNGLFIDIDKNVAKHIVQYKFDYNFNIERNRVINHKQNIINLINKHLNLNIDNNEVEDIIDLYYLPIDINY